MNKLLCLSIFIATCAVARVATADPQYQIIDLGTIDPNGFSQGFGASAGGVGVGRTIPSNFQSSQAFSWTYNGGRVDLPNLVTSPNRPFDVANGANDLGTVVGTASTSLSGNSRLPVMWQNGVVSQLPLPAGQTLGDAYGVNASGVAVGSAGSGTPQRGVIYSNGTGAIITQTTPGGSYFTTAFGINNSGRVVGIGVDPNNAARNVGMVYDIGSNSAFEVGTTTGYNGAIAFGVSNAGSITGASTQNQGPGMPFFYSGIGGTILIPLAAGTSEGEGRGVNSAGWVVGTDGGAFAVPFLWNGQTTFRLQDLIPANSGWDLSMNTSSSADGIGDNDTIVGTGLFDGQIHAYAMVLVPEPATCALMVFGALSLLGATRARRKS